MSQNISNGIKVSDLGDITTIASDNQIMVLTNDELNTLQNITISNFVQNLISNQTNNGIELGNDNKFYVDATPTGVVAGTYQYVKNLAVNNKGQVISVEQGQEASVPVATSSSLGIIQPDNTTITIDNNGTISVDETGLTTITTELNSKMNIDLSNINDTATSIISKLPMPSKSYIDLTLGASGTNYTAPANGWFCTKMSPANTNNAVYLENSTAHMATTGTSGTSYYTQDVFIPATKGDIIRLDYLSIANVGYFRFIYAQGSESEAE